MQTDYDIIIVGGGIVGSTLALALAKNTSLQIALIDSQKLSTDWQAGKYQPRVSAISLASQRIFQNLNVWDKMREKRISPYQKMHVWDSNAKGEINFDCQNLNAPALGFIVEDNVMRLTLLSEIKAQKNIHLLAPLQITSFEEKSDHIELKAEDDIVMKAKLLVAADGGNSWVREQAGIKLKSWDYQHKAIVATVTTNLPHDGTARQVFLPTGPLAFLPLLDENLSSIVWSTSPENAAELLALDDAGFQQALAAAFNYKLGDISQVDRRYDFSLQMRHAKNYVQSRLALVGDAAHTIHPLAGQGVNLGLLDAACLAEVIMLSSEKNRDFGSLSSLRRYERWRKGDNLAMLAFVDAIKNLFGSSSKPLQQLRSFGLNAANNLDFVKKFFTAYASGQREDLPRLACVGQ